MRNLSPTSHQLVEEFFRDYLGDSDFDLPRVRFATGRVALFAASVLKIQGLTIGPVVLIAPALLARFEDRTVLPRDLIVHEITHVLQYREFGFFGFLRRYFGSYLRNIRKEGNFSAETRHAAYLAIPFEIEARQTAFDFMRWSADRRPSG